MRLPVPFAESYKGTRTSYDDQRRVNMYPHARRGLRQRPAAVLFSEEAGKTPTYNSSKTLDNNSFTVEGVSWNSDGTNLYSSDDGNNEINEYACSTAYDPSTGTLTSTFTFTHSPGTLYDFIWANSGAKLYICDGSSVYQYSASTAYDVSTLSYDSKTFNFTANVTACTSLIMNSTGTKVFVLDGNSSADIYSYTLSTAYDISTASYDSVTFDVNALTSNGGKGMTVNPDGTKIWVGATNNNIKIYMINLSTAWDLSTASLDNFFDVAGTSTGGAVNSMAWDSDGSSLTICTGGSQDIEVYDTISYSFGGLGFGDVVFTAQSPSYDVESFATNWLLFNDDGTKCYTSDGNNLEVDEWTLTTAWDVSTASITASFAATHPTPTFYRTGTIIEGGASWGDSGGKFYIWDTDQNIYQYSASTAYDVTTLSYDSKSVSTGVGTGVPTFGPIFSSDGTTAVWASTINLYQYTLGTAWDISTASSTNTVAYRTYIEDNDSAIGIAANNDGTKLYITTKDALAYELELSTAWDITTISLGGTENFGATIIDVASTLASGGVESTFASLVWGDDGKRLFGVVREPAQQVGSWKKAHLVQFSATVTYSLLSSTETVEGAIRGAEVMDGIPYAVAGGGLYSFDSDGKFTFIGTIAGTERVIMETDGVQLVITTGADGGTIYRYTVALGLETITASAVEDTAKSSAYLDLAFYLDQADGKLIASDNNDATSYSTDDVLEAESFADDIIRMFSHNQLLYAFGESTTEVYYTSGVGRPPITRQQVIERGIIGTHAIDSIDDSVFFVDQYTRPNMLSGLQYQPIYTPAIAERWGSYTTTSDCIVNAYAYRQQNLVDFVFPTENESWTYHVASGQWFKSEDSSGDRSDVTAYVEAYNKTLAFSRSRVWVLELSETGYRDKEGAMTRTVDTDLITTELFGENSIAGEQMVCNSLKLTFESTAEATITISLQKDGGSFAQSRSFNVPAGTYTKELNRWGKFREAIWRITTTANAGVDIVDISGDFEVLSD